MSGWWVVGVVAFGVAALFVSLHAQYGPGQVVGWALIGGGLLVTYHALERESETHDQGSSA